MRLSAGNLKPTFTEGAERQRGERRVNHTTVRKTKTDIGLIILRILLLRNLAFFVSRYLKFLVSEEICGRFGSFDEQTTAYRLTRATSYEGVR